MTHTVRDMIASLKNKRNRLDYERQVQMQCIRPVLLGSHTNNTVLKEIRRQKKEDSSIRTDDEKMLWDQLREVEKLPSLQSRLWRYRQPVDKDHFMKWVRGGWCLSISTLLHVSITSLKSRSSVFTFSRLRHRPTRTRTPNR